MRTLLVIPCLRERARLPRFLPELLKALRQSNLEADVDVLVVDDGSDGVEQEWLDRYLDGMRSSWPNLLPPLLLPKNSGKGGAVYAGWNQPGKEYSHAGFVDADGAIPPEETARLCGLVARLPGAALFAVRTGTDGTRVRRHPGRALAGLAFRWLVKGLFRFPIPETQCGCKFVPLQAFRRLSGTLTEYRFCFDVELTWQLLHTGVSIHPVPVNWQEIPGGQLRPAGVFAMIRSLVRLRLQLGPWDRPPDPPSTPSPAAPPSPDLPHL